MSFCCQSPRTPSPQTALGRWWFCCMMPSVPTLDKNHLHPSSDIHHILTSLDRLQTNPTSRDQLRSDFDSELLYKVLSSPEMEALIKVHESLTSMADPVVPESEGHSMMQSVVQMSDELQNRHLNQDMKELYNILNKAHIRGLSIAHDDLINKSYAEALLPEVPYEVDEDEESIQVVRIIKGNNEPLGATIRVDEETGAIRIARVMRGGAADRSGLLFVGDEVCSINGSRVSGKHPDQIVNILAGAVGPIILTLIAGEKDTSTHEENKMHVRANFSYNPNADQLSPCTEAGLAFDKGDILEIVNQEDPHWWQAKKINGDSNIRAGLIPAKQFQERKPINWSNLENDLLSHQTKLPRKSSIPKPLIMSKNIKDYNCKNSGKMSLKSMKKSKKNKKIFYQAQKSEEYDNEEFVTYEEVELMHPDKLKVPRPVVITGPPGVGKTSLERRLIDSNPDQYQSPIKHTDRPIEAGETYGEDYIFLERDILQSDIQSNCFIDVEEIDNDHYCISMDSIKSTMNNNKTCVLCLHPQALKRIRISDIKPFIVLIKSPPRHVLYNSRLQQDDNHVNQSNQYLFTEDMLDHMVKESDHLETICSSYIDHVIVNDDLIKASNELISTCEQMRLEAQWVPVHWTR